MTRALPILFALFMLALVGKAFADYSEKWISSSVAVKSVTLDALPDGGCQVQASARVSKEDGGSAMFDSRPVEVSGANQTACLALLGKAAVLFKADKGL